MHISRVWPAIFYAAARGATATLLAALALPSASARAESDAERRAFEHAVETLPLAKTCKDVEKVDFPAEDRFPDEKTASIAAGDSARFYYGIGRPVDYVAARRAAFAELAQELIGDLGANDVLLMLYANGYGVKKNEPLAQKLVCSNELAAEMEKRNRLVRLTARKDRSDAKPFDFCDDVTSGVWESACTSVQLEREQARVDALLAAQQSSWPAAARESLPKLKQAAHDFQQARLRYEMEEGTYRATAGPVEEEKALHAAFVERLEAAAMQAPPRSKTADFKRSDVELNAAYKAALAADYSDSNLTPDVIRAVQRKWLAYRKAWVAFGTARYSDSTPESWISSLNEERTRQLKGEH